jgi:hypothetical protein
VKDFATLLRITSAKLRLVRKFRCLYSTGTLLEVQNSINNTLYSESLNKCYEYLSQCMDVHNSIKNICSVLGW